MELTVPRGQRGMSLIEVVLASLLLLVIAVGVLPMFIRSMASNAAGADATQVSNMAVERAEELLQLPFDAPDLTLAAGDTSRVFEEVWTREDGRFITGTETTARSADKYPMWVRVTTIRQFNVNDLTTQVPGSPAGTPDPSAQLKEIEVAVTGLREGGPLGASRNLTVRVLKSP